MVSDLDTVLPVLLVPMKYTTVNFLGAVVAPGFATQWGNNLFFENIGGCQFKVGINFLRILNFVSQWADTTRFLETVRAVLTMGDCNCYVHNQITY